MQNYLLEIILFQFFPFFFSLDWHDRKQMKCCCWDQRVCRKRSLRKRTMPFSPCTLWSKCPWTLCQLLVSAVQQNPDRDKTEHLSSDIPRDFGQLPNPFENLILIAWSKIKMKSPWTPRSFLQWNPTFTLSITLIRRKADTSMRTLISTGLCSCSTNSKEQPRLFIWIRTQHPFYLKKTAKQH